MLDTCTIIWDALDRHQLSTKAPKAINQADEQNELMIADISLWEISMLIKKKRIHMNTNAANFINLFLKSRSLSIMPISAEIAELSTSFDSEINNDPADRIIAATTIIHHAQLVTADKNLIDSKLINTIW